VLQGNSNGAWNTEISSPLPPTSTGSAKLFDVNCASSTACIAVGQYYQSGSNLFGLIETGAGSGYAATQAPLPTGANAVNPAVNLSAVSCAAVGSCLAVGDYTDVSSDVDGLLDTDSGGTWAAAEVPSPPAGGTFLGLGSVSCVASWGCVAVGEYQNAAAGVGPETVAAPL
jgi:hypothetical protein